MSQLNELVSAALKADFGDIWVRGELSDPRSFPSGHRYFTLKDETSQIDAVCFRHAAARFGLNLEDGLAVVVHGRLDLYIPRGRYQLVVDAIEPTGVGALKVAYERLKSRLAEEGLFEEGRKRLLPGLPRVIGVVTSPSGAAVHDMLRTFRLQGAMVSVFLVPVQVQGEGAADQIAEGIDILSRREDVDVLIVARGGGSMEDLWAFNEETVARAIAASRVPVVTGVGHEVDFTIADFVADVRAATPTAAAQVVTRGWPELSGRLGVTVARLHEAVDQRLLDGNRRFGDLVRHRSFDLLAGLASEQRLRSASLTLRAEKSFVAGLGARRLSLENLRARLRGRHPLAELLRRRARLHSATSGLDRTGIEITARRSERLAGTAAHLEALSPLSSLQRGYAICRSSIGRLVTRTSDVTPGEGMAVRVVDGEIDCRVSSIRSGE